MKEYIKENMALVITILATFGLLILMGVILNLSSKSTQTVINVDESQKNLLIRDDSHVFGKEEAGVEVVEFSDFQCPACAYYYLEFEKFKTTYSSKIKFVFRNFPLTSIHPVAFKAAEAAEAAGSQGKFWEFHNILFENQKEWSILRDEELINKFVDYANEIAISDIAKFRDDLESEAFKSKVQKDMQDAEELNIPGTPTVFVNGKKVENPTFENLKSASGF